MKKQPPVAAGADRSPAKNGKSSSKRRPKARSGRPSSALAESRAKNLRNVAAEVFLEFGFERAKLSEIVKRAGASKETLYSQYANKEVLFKAVIQGYLKDAFKPFGLLSGPSLPPLEQTLKNLAFGLLSYILLEDSQRLSDVMYQEASRFPELGRHFYDVSYGRAIAELKSFFDAHVRAGNVVQGDTEVMARQFLELTVTTFMIKSLLQVERSATPTARRAWVGIGVDTFLELYAS